PLAVGRWLAAAGCVRSRCSALTTEMAARVATSMAAEPTATTFRSRVSTTLSLMSSLLTGSGQEHGTEQVVALEELLGRPVEADHALLDEVGVIGDGEGEVGRLLDEDHRHAGCVDRPHLVDELLHDQ